jgi:hypothetical protein
LYINESLANGLKERLWNELDGQDIKGRKNFAHYLKTHKLKLGSRTGIQKLDQAFRFGHGHSILAAEKSGSRTSPTLLYAILERDPQSVINDWQEKMFCIRQIAIDTMGNWIEYPVNVRIGEHAVSRVFQRHPEIYNSHTREFDIVKIIPEFKSIAFLGQSMLELYATVTSDYNHSLENISIPFVSKSGLFLGVYNKQLITCDIRTFIADHQLTPDQDTLVKQIRSLLEDNYHYFEFLPFGKELLKGGYQTHYYVFLVKLYSVAHQFAKLATWNEKNLEFRREFHQLLINYLSLFEFMNPILNKKENEMEAMENAIKAREDAKLKKK